MQVEFRSVTGTVAVLALILALPLPAQGDPGPDRPRQDAGASQPLARAAALGARDLAAAMDVPLQTLVSADIGDSDPRAFAISDGAPLPAAPVPMSAPAAAGSGSDFPSKGDTFLVMSTGDASQAMRPPSDIASTELSGEKNSAGTDLAQLHLKMTPPNGARCLAFDVAFLSEEYPEYVGMSYDDSFTAQLGTGETAIVGGKVQAEGNFAQDTRGNPLSINTVFGMNASVSTVYDGQTSRLRAVTPVNTAEVDLFLTIQDLGDSVVDSAVFLDNFFWSTDRGCRFGSLEDTDGDGLLDDWEANGLTMATPSGVQFVDLSAMGADPNVPDVFVEIDYMANQNHSHAPNPTAIKSVVDAFARNNIRLHVDYGPAAPLTYGSAATWGQLSESNALPHVDRLGDNGPFGWFGYRWAAFDDRKDEHFSEARAAVFHYNIWAHQLSEQLGSTSGFSRGSLEGASDFIVSLGGWSGQTGTVANQAGTFMHELGHNLGLGHGGDEHVNEKPNYLSVMNYSFQSGLPNAGANTYDYSSKPLPDLDEESLWEVDGIGDPQDTLHYGCTSKGTRTPGAPIDWNCDGDTSDVVSRDVNGDGRHTVLRGVKDWDRLRFSGGAIGRPGATDDLPEETVPEVPELTVEMAEQIERAWEGADEAAPEVSVPPELPSAPVKVGTPVEARLPFTGTEPGAVQVAWSWGDGATSAGAVSTDPSTTAVGSHTYSRAGRFAVTATLTAAGGTATSASAEVVVQDPAAGGLNAVASIHPVEGAAPGVPAAAGPAAVVLSANWVGRGQQLVVGTVVDWPAARMRVVGHGGDWLVVDSKTAVMESAATVNGRGIYRQRVTATGGPAPTIRIQVWDPALGGPDDETARVLDTGVGRPAKGLVVVGKS